MKESSPWIIKPLVPDEIYTDREEFLEFFHRQSLRAATRRSMSTVLLGRRRMGKTEIFKRVVNQLFFEQDPNSPNAVVPVYFSFPERAEDEWRFAKNYVANFIRHYVGFYVKEPQIIRNEEAENELLASVERVRSRYPFRDTLDWLLRRYQSLLSHSVTIPLQTALESIRHVSDIDDTTIVVFLDELQNTRLPQYSFDIVGYLKEAVESPTCPHFVTGSAMSILSREIIGRGSLFGRFESKPIGPLSPYWGTQQALRSARYYGVELPEEMAPMVADRCGGNPFYINAVIRRAEVLQQPLLNEEIINNILAVDISSGFIWAELYEQVSSWIARINNSNITKWILYLSALESEDRISIERIQQALRRRESKEISLDQIRDVLVKLSRGDLLEYLELGGWFRKTNDPILLEFLKVWGRIEVQGEEDQAVQDEIISRYKHFTRRFAEYQGYLAEVFMGQVLLSSQDQSKMPLPGRFFNSLDDIHFDWPLTYVRHRVRLKSGTGQEIDLLGAIGIEKWVCQSKWVTTQKIGVEVIRTLIAQADAVQVEFPLNRTRMWLFAHEGLTEEAATLAQEMGVLWSDRAQLDALLSYLGLRQLPTLPSKNT